MSNGFIALDVETANPWYGSICQVGLAESVDGRIVNEWSFLVNPKSYFDPFNVGIHGITEEMVAEAPTIIELWEELLGIIGDNVVAHHGPFDRASIAQAVEGSPNPPPEFRWLDTARVVRRHWSELSHRGYGLKPVSEMLGYEFQHHDALEDAKAAAFILNRVIEESGKDLEWWARRAYQRCSAGQYHQHKSLNRAGSPDGVLVGETVLFTGALSLPRREIADIAAEHGCNVVGSITKKVTMLVVGEQDLSKLKGHSKSSKHRKAEAAIAKGQSIRILGEEGFIAALELDEMEQQTIEERALEKASKKNRRDAKKARRSLLIEIDVNDFLPDDFKEKLAKLTEFYERNPEAQKEDEIIDAFEDMSLDELRALDCSEFSEYVLEALDDEINLRIDEL